MSKSKFLALFVAAIAVVLFGAWSVKQRHSSELRIEVQPRAVLREIGITSSSRPQLAMSTAGVLYLLAAYQENGQHRLGLSMSHDGGDTFSALAPVSQSGADVAAHGENGPSLALTSTAVYALWQQRSGDGPQQIVFARSLGMGHAFETPIIVTDKQQPSFNGFSSLTVAPNGNVYAVWLDGRNRKPGTFDVYLAHSSDKGASFSKNFVAVQGACPCCRPAVAFGDNREVFVAFRKVLPGDVRDIV
jgi:hypothetical protein